MNVLLLSVQNVRIDKRNKNYNGTEEPGLAAIAGYLQANGHIVKVARIDNDVDHFELIERISPQLIGISTYDRFFPYQLEITESIKIRFPEIAICLGGYTASYHGYELMERYSFIDYIIKGEGEIALEKLAVSLQEKDGFQNIGGLIYRENDVIMENSNTEIVKNLNELPFANRDIIIDSYINLVQISSSRGCTGHCGFCCSFDFWKCEQGKRIFRRMDPVRVIDEIEYIVKNIKKTRFTFTDNSFEDPNNDLIRQKEIAEEIIRRKLCIGYDISYKTNFYKHCTPELLNLLIDSGLFAVFIGFESGNSEDLKLYRKQCTVKDNDKAIEFYKNFEDLNIVLGFINFNAYTDVNRLKANLDFLEKHGYANDFSYFTSKLAPFKGTSIYDKLQQDNLLTGSIYDNGYTFKYIHEEIKSFENYIFSVTQKYKSLKDSRYICSVLPCILTHLKNEAKFHKNQKVVDLISGMRRLYKEVLADLNVKMSFWLRELINQLENGWSEEQSEKISKYHMEDKGIIKKIDDLKIMRNKLYMDLIKIDSAYSERF